MLGRDTQSPQILGRVRAEHGGVGRYERLILKPQTSTGKGPQWIGNVASLHRTVGSDNGLFTPPIFVASIDRRANRSGFHTLPCRSRSCPPSRDADDHADRFSCQALGRVNITQGRICPTFPFSASAGADGYKPGAAEHSVSGGRLESYPRRGYHRLRWPLFGKSDSPVTQCYLASQGKLLSLTANRGCTLPRLPPNCTPRRLAAASAVFVRWLMASASTSATAAKM